MEETFMSDKNMLYLQIRDYVLNLIEQYKNTPGYILPSENQLAQKFNASRISAKHAYDTLEEEHLIIRQRGRGTFIAPHTETDSALSLMPTRMASEKKAIAVILPFINSVFMSELSEGIRLELSQRDIPFFIFLTGNDQKKETMFLQLAQSNCQGALFFPGAFSKYQRELLELVLNRFPLVQIDRYLPGLDLSYVSCDHFHAAYHAVEYLLQHNYRKIGYVTHPAPHASSIVDRLAGFEKAIKKFDPLYPANYTLTARSDSAHFEQLFTEYLRQIQPEAIISSSVNFHIAIMRILKNLGLDCRIDLMLFDNVFMPMQDYIAYHPYIIDQQPREIGRASVDLLCRLIEDEIQPETITIPEKIYRL